MKSRIWDILRLLGLGLLVWILSQVDWHSVFSALREFPPFVLALYFGVFFAGALLKILRMYLLLKSLKVDISFYDVYGIVTESAFYGLLTPARVGEFSKVAYLIKHGLPSAQAWWIVILERLIDLGTLLSAGVAGIYLFFLSDYDVWGSAATFISLIGLMAALLWHASPLLEKFFGLARKFLPSHKFFSQQNVASALISSLAPLSTKIFVPISLMVLVISFLQIYCLAHGFGANVPLLYMGLSSVVATAISLLPISISGLGTREAIYIALLNRFGVARGVAVSISLLDGLILGALGLAIMLAIRAIISKKRV